MSRPFDRDSLRTPLATGVFARCRPVGYSSSRRRGISVSSPLARACVSSLGLAIFLAISPVVQAASGGLDSPVQAQQACDQGDANECENLGQMYEDGQGVPKNMAYAAKLYAKACDGGNGSGCHDLGLLYGRSNNAQDKAFAAQMMIKACREGYAGACDQNIAAAASPPNFVANAAASASHQIAAAPNASISAAPKPDSGSPGGSDKPKSKSDPAWEAYVAAATAKYSVCHDQPLVPGQSRFDRDDKESKCIAAIDDQELRAKFPDEKDCQKNIALSCHRAGYAAFAAADRLFIFADSRASLGVEMYEKGCDLKDVDSCYNLGIQYMSGEKISGSAVYARTYFKRACDLGDKESCAKESEAAQKINEDEKAACNKQDAAYLANHTYHGYLPCGF